MVLFVIPDFLTSNIHYSFSFKPRYSLFIIQLPPPIFHVTCYDIFHNIRSLALKRKLEKYGFQGAYCDSKKDHLETGLSQLIL